MTDLAFASLRSTLLILVGLLGIALLMRQRSAAARHHALRILFIVAFVGPLIPVPAYLVPKYATMPVPAPMVQAAPVWTPSTLMPSGSSRLRTPAVSELDDELITILTGLLVFNGIWFVVSALLYVSPIRAFKRLKAIERNAVPLDSFDGFSVLRATDPELRVPVAYGPSGTVLLPSESQEWTEDRLRAVLLHEAAHLHRADPAWIVLASSIALLWWFSPGFFMLARALRDTAEEAADDAVLAAGMRPSDYARELLAVARQTSSLGDAAVAMVGRDGLRNRVVAILAPRRDRRRATATLSVATGITLGLAALGMACVGFRMDRLTMPLPEGAVVSNTGHVTLKDGSQLFLTSIEEITMKRVVAWNEYGNAVWTKGGPYFLSLFPNRPEKQAYLAFDITLFSPGHDPGITIRLPERFRSQGFIAPRVPGTETERRVRAMTQLIDAPEFTTDLGVGVATGAWRRIAVQRVPQSERHADSQRQDVVEFSLPKEAQGAQWRPLATSKIGKPIPLNPNYPRSQDVNGPRPHAVFGVRLAPGERVARVEIEVRPYQWAVFRNVSLHPSRAALAKARRPILKSDGNRDIESYRIVGTEAMQ